MADLQRAVPKPDQSCPICGARLPAGVFYCERCGNDLSRAGMVMSSSVRPVSRRRNVHALVRRMWPPFAAAVAVITLALLASTVPAVGARVPMLRGVGDPIEEAVGAAWSWGLELISPPQKRTAPPTSRKTAPAGAPKATGRQKTPSGVVPKRTGSYLIVRSAPDGADVYVNTERVGATPLVVSLPPGTYRVRLSRAGYASVARTVEVDNDGIELALRLRSVTAPGTSARPPAAPAPKVSRQTGGALPIGSTAPAFRLKDRLGIIHRLSDWKDQGLTLLFIWDLDESGKQAVRRLAANRGARQPAVVVLLRPDRITVRDFVEAERITIPVLFGDARVAASYRVPVGVPMIYLLSDSSRIHVARPVR